MGIFSYANILISILLLYLSVYLIVQKISNLIIICVALALILIPSLVHYSATVKKSWRYNLFRTNTTLRYYTRMQLFVSVSLYANVWIFFVNEMATATVIGFLQPIGIILATAFFVILLTLLWYGIFSKRWIKTSLFVVGAVLCLGAQLITTWGWFKSSVLYYCLYFGGMSMLLASVTMFSQEILQATTLLGDGKFPYKLNFMWVNIKAQLLAIALFCAMYFVFATLLHIKWFVGYALQIVSGVCLILAIISVLAFPIDKRYANKLQQYYNQQGDNINWQLLQQQLHCKLSKGQNSATLAILKFIVKPFFKSKVRGKNNVNTKSGAVVFVANHYEIYGPIVAMLRLPFQVRPWVISSMLDKDIIEQQLKAGVDNIFHLLPQKMRNKIPALIRPLLLKILWGFDPIPVYRGTTREVLTTLKLTVEALQQGDNILLFPEKPDVKYSTEGIDKFYTGFAEIGVRYWRATGKNITFYPVYVDKYNKETIIGKGITFDGQQDHKAQKLAIANGLNEAMVSISQAQMEKWKQKQARKKKRMSKEQPTEQSKHQDDDKDTKM